MQVKIGSRCGSLAGRASITSLAPRRAVGFCCRWAGPWDMGRTYWAIGVGLGCGVFRLSVCELDTGSRTPWRFTLAHVGRV